MNFFPNHGSHDKIYFYAYCTYLYDNIFEYYSIRINGGSYGTIAALINTVSSAAYAVAHNHIIYKTDFGPSDVTCREKRGG
jgi:hypothetical protein